MTFSELRIRHPRLVYESFETKQENGKLIIRFSIILEPGITFHPELTLPLGAPVDQSVVNALAFHMGLMECISYWKLACPAELVVNAGSLNQEQIFWWYDLFLNGLGEFFFKNDIDFTQKDFLAIKNSELRTQNSFSLPTPLSRDLVLTSGGKDSAVTLELLKNSGRPTRPLVLNPTRAMLDNIKIAGLRDPFIVNRTIDSKLLELNKVGYLNGHTPFSAYLAFLGITVAVLHGYDQVLVSQEASANEGNVLFHGKEINHQYSKSFHFEKIFRDYLQTYLTKTHHFFSFLRPLNEFQISMLFSQFPQYFGSFRSCNVGAKKDTWCGACAKCAFMYLVLFPFVPYEQMVAIFGSDLFTKPEIIGLVRELVGLTNTKPFECVGTKDEAKLSLALSIHRYQTLGKEVLLALLDIAKELKLDPPMVEKLKETVVKAWNNEHFVPDAYMKLLKDAQLASSKY